MENQINKNNLLKNPWFYASVIFLIIVSLLLIIKPIQRGTGLAVDDSLRKIPQQQIPQETQVIDVSIDDDAIKGNENAPITIIEFSDYECPYCATFYFTTLSQLEKEYIEKGKVRFVYRDFPLVSIHADAQKASEATEVAHELGGNGKFWEMHNKIFENQQAITVADLKQYAREIGLDGEKFDRLLDSGKYKDEVEQDLQDGFVAGVRGTPTFFINGEVLVGAQPFEVFKQIIERELI